MEQIPYTTHHNPRIHLHESNKPQRSQTNVTTRNRKNTTLPNNQLQQLQ